MIGLVDCNNFFASCERVFRPDLRNKPVVVLSNNDGCVIARSNEAKALGIKMGTPMFRLKDFALRNDVAVFSSNYSLYADMSRRVMTLLADATPGITQYSIDECFIDLRGIGSTGESLNDFAHRIVRTITKGTGIPVTMGIADTKTLAKVASKFGKKYKGYDGVCIIDTDEKRQKALQLLDIADVWGVGRRTVDMLRTNGINTAWDLTQRSNAWVRRVLSVTGERTWRELRGESCIDIDELPQKRSICTSRSFPDQGIDDLMELAKAVANFAASCVRKLQEQHSCCQSVTTFAYTSRFRADLPSHAINHTVNLSVATYDLREIVAAAVTILRSQFRKGCHYKKAGVILWNISDSRAIQTDLFDTVDRTKQWQLADAIDTINKKNGRNAVRVAVQGNVRDWKLKSEYLTKCYTTNLDDIINVILK